MSQILCNVGKIPEIARGLREGDHQSQKNWLVQNVNRHVRSSTPSETLMRVPGGTLNAVDYIADLTEKVDTLFA